MELGAEISQKVKKTIKKQLQTLGCYVDDELPEYIMVMIANKRTREQMVDDLNLFLNDEAEKFVSWLTVVLGRIQKAMELPDIDGIVEDVGNAQESKKKLKKLKKDRKTSESEENMKNERHERKKSEEKRRMKEIKDRETEEKEREKRKQERLDKQKEKEAKESERREKEHKQRMEDRLRREKEREEEATKRRLAREEEINKRRAAREKRDKEEKEKREERKKKEKEEQEEKENREKLRKHNETKKRQEVRKSEDEEKQENESEHTDDSGKEKINGLDDTKEKETDADVRREAEHEAKRIENRGSRNPMEFVKQIAKDITDQLKANQSTTPSQVSSTEKGTEVTKTKSDSGSHVEGESKKDTSDNADLTLRENVSLQAVSQYEDGENDVEKGDNKSQHKSKKHKHRQHRSGNRSSRSRSKSETRHHNYKEARSVNKSRSCERGRKHHHSRSRSHSKEKHERKSRKDNERRSSSKKDENPSDNRPSKTKNESDEDSSKKRNHDNSKSVDKNESSKRKDNKSESPRRRSSHGHQSRRDSNEGSGRRNSKDMTDKVEEDESPAKPSVSSQVQIFTDFKRKPSLAKHHQASTVLLKRAVTEVVNEKPEGEENGDDVELDYNETNDENDEGSDEASNDVVLERRRVINFDKEKSGLPTITVNFNKNNSSNSDNDNKLQRTVRSNDRDRNRMSTSESRHPRSSTHGSSHLRKSTDDKDVERRKGLIPGISKYDARYTILRSRLEHEGPTNDRKVRHESKQEKSSNREKSLSSMVADLEEKSKKHNTRSSWRDQRNGNDSNNKHKERQRGSHRRHQHMADGDSSGEDEEDKQQRVTELKKEARRIEMQELSRSGQSDEGDLRDLLVGKREVKSSSEEEGVSARRLREKIKEEKHKILFGKLNTEERDRSKRERENLCEQLKTKNKRRKFTESKDSPEWIEKVPEKHGESKDHNDVDEKPERNIFVENVTDSEEEDRKEEAATAAEDGKDNNEEEENSEEELAHGSEVETDDDSKGGDDEEEDEEEDQNAVHHPPIIHQNDLEEVSDEELADDSEKEMDEEEENGTGGKMEILGDFKEETVNYVRGESDILETDKEQRELGEELEEEVVEEVVEIEVEVSDNENLDGNEDDTISQEGNKDTGKYNEDEINDVIEVIDVGAEDVSTEVLKHSMHFESSDESPINDENPDESSKDTPTDMKSTDKYDKKSKQRYSKRKRMRHEFIVTLDGLADGKRLSIKTGGREKSPKVRRLQEKPKSDRHRRHRHISRSQSDEEFEEILRRKEEEEKRNIGQSRIPDGKKSHRSRSQPSNDKDTKHRELRVNREIMLAENKLKTQKVFKKSLETVQNVTNNLSVTNVANNLEQGTPKTAFINPNFQPKLPVETMNAAVAIIPSKIGFNKSPIKVLAQPPAINQKPICNLGSTVPEKIILAPTVFTSASEKLLVAPVRITRSKNFMLTSAALDIVALPHVDMSAMKKNLIKPPIDNSAASKNVIPLPSKETSLSTEAPTSTHKIHVAENSVEGGNVPVSSSSLTEPAVSEESRSAPSATPAKATIQERCVFWPECKNQTCPFIHPSINCKLFPNCSYGQHCIYIHPPCMFGDSCSNASCPFTHVSSAPSVFSGFSQICKYYPNCTKGDCPFKHVAKPCHFGAACKNPECMFSHDDDPLPASSLKWVAEKAHVSERKFAADDAIVSHIPVSIVTSNG